MSEFVYKTWHCDSCPVQTSNKAFAKLHPTSKPEYAGHKMIEQKWEPTNG